MDIFVSLWYHDTSNNKEAVHMTLGQRLMQLRGRAGLSQDALAERLGIRFADAGTWGIPLAYDGVHFTEQGHKNFAAGLLEELR